MQNLLNISSTFARLLIYHIYVYYVELNYRAYTYALLPEEIVVNA